MKKSQVPLKTSYTPVILVGLLAVLSVVAISCVGSQKSTATVSADAADPASDASATPAGTYKYFYSPPWGVTSFRVFAPENTQVFVDGAEGWGIFPVQSGYPHTFAFGPLTQDLTVKTSQKPTKIIWRRADGTEHTQEITQ